MQMVMSQSVYNSKNEKSIQLYCFRSKSSKVDESMKISVETNTLSSAERLFQGLKGAASYSFSGAGPKIPISPYIHLRQT